LLSDLADFNFFWECKGWFHWLFLVGFWRLEIWNVWLAGFSMFSCNVFRTKKWGKNITVRRFLGLCERVSPRILLAGSG